MQCIRIFEFHPTLLIFEELDFNLLLGFHMMYIGKSHLFCNLHFLIAARSLKS